MDFYQGRVLQVDLSAGTATTEPLNMEWAERYIGGKGLLLRYMWEYVPAGVDPWAADNPVFLVTGPFAGTTVSTASRLVVGAKSPVTGILDDSYVGGSFAPEMKFAGYDLIIIKGIAASPTVLWINDGKVEFVPAGEKYWGLKTSEIEEALRADLDENAKVLSIGPAGENLVPWACLSTDQYHKAGRGGHGALFGSKNLKAVAIRGTGSVRVGDARAFQADIERINREHVLTDFNLWANEEGTPILVDPVNGAGALPTRNWSQGSFDGAEGINSESFQKVKVGNRACYQCALGCRQVHQAGGVKCEGPEYETIALCGSNCGIGDIEALMRFNHECDEWGLDTISSGSVVALAMDMTERDIVDFGLRFGEVKGYMAAPELIATREGVGAYLALGARALATEHGVPELAMEVKNLECPGYDPRGAFGMSLAYATADRGGCHMRAYPIADEVLEGTRPADSLEGKAEQIINGNVANGFIGQNFSSMKFSGIWCDFWAVDPDQLCQMLRHVWRRGFTEDEIMLMGERIWNLGRLFNLREGVESDKLPRKLFASDFAHKEGPSAGKAIGEEALENALQEYYRLRGWDKRGIPTEAKLAEVGVDVRL
ncbi:MAG: aldehyde ferredoxin oxidoreductase family protein [Thermoleophilia bacterium]|nr:aldehyde ferredoxin oxidoreductase family protein [Thermoleophilia bacterium]